MTKQWNKINKIKDKPNRIRQNKKTQINRPTERKRANEKNKKHI